MRRIPIIKRAKTNAGVRQNETLNSAEAGHKGNKKPTNALSLGGFFRFQALPGTNFIGGIGAIE
jgi:hypothetical protein